MQFKRIISRCSRIVITSMVTLLSISHVHADTWKDPSTGYKWTYRIIDDYAEIYRDDSATISPSTPGRGYAAIEPFPSGHIVVPSVLGGKPVIRIGNFAFEGLWKITDVTIPSGVESIGRGAFSGCEGLGSIKIPDTMKRIEKNAFDGCTKLYNTGRIPGVKIVDGWAVGFTELLSGDLNLSKIRGVASETFYNCANLTSIWLPNGVTSIGASTFYGCTSLTNAIVPDSVVHIERQAFRDCAKLMNIKMPENLKVIGCYAFSDCRALTSVTLPYGVECIDEDAFVGCHNLVQIILPDSITNIAAWAFCGCTSLLDIQIPTSVHDIRRSSFQGCVGISDFNITANITNIEPAAFSFCTNLVAFTVSEKNMYYKESNGMLLSKDGHTLIAAPGGVSDIMIPECIQTIEPWAFSGCQEIQNLIIPDGVLDIGICAFNMCDNLKEILIPQSVTNISSWAFTGCTSLSDVVFMGDAPNIGDNCFTGVNPSCVVHVDKGSSGWGIDMPDTWNGMQIIYRDDNTIQELPENASDFEVATALASYHDSNLIKNIKDAIAYAAYRRWALAITNTLTTTQTIKDSSFAWLSFALGADAIIQKSITSNDLHIVSFEINDTSTLNMTLPSFTFEVVIDDVNIGGGTVSDEVIKENLKKVFGVEGATTLSSSAFTPDNIEIVFDLPVNGKARFTAITPVNAGDSFFMRVKIK